MLILKNGLYLDQEFCSMCDYYGGESCPSDVCGFLGTKTCNCDFGDCYTK